MSRYLTNFQLGNLKLPNNILCAPLAGYTDSPFRQICSGFSPGLMFCEMIKFEALVRKIPATMRYLEFDPKEYPLGKILSSN